MPKEKKPTGVEKTILEYLTKQNRPYGLSMYKDFQMDHNSYPEILRFSSMLRN
ncbi:hypothetical protein BGW41_003568 [Actinomortierella wolfii]|nr:hypothetical protein BGW41_003568 [Actinomortierella wolfii]